MDRLGVRRIALLSPYPSWLTEASCTYWASQCYDIVSWARMSNDTSDTVNIYGLTTDRLLSATEELETDHADAILITGTGVATLPAVRPVFEYVGKPILSSNISLAWSLLDALGLGHLVSSGEPCEYLIGGWSSRCNRL